MKSHHFGKRFRIIFPYIIGHNNISWRVGDPTTLIRKSVGSRPPTSGIDA